VKSVKFCKTREWILSFPGARDAGKIDYSPQEKEYFRVAVHIRFEQLACLERVVLFEYPEDGISGEREHHWTAFQLIQKK
jgi:hypothetical protein